MINRVKTPCIGVCSTGIGDDVCRGCKRFEHEVVSWNSYSNQQKRFIINRLDSHLKTILSDKLEIFDTIKLEATLNFQKIRYDKYAAPENWLFTLLTRAATQITDPTEHGFNVLRKAKNTSLTELKEQIDADLFTLSCVYFERHYKPVP